MWLGKIQEKGKKHEKMVEVLVIQSCMTLCNPMDCSPQGFSVHGILQARILEWVAIPFSRRSPWPRDQAQVPCIAGRFVIVWATREASIHGVAESNTAEWLTQESRYLYWHNSLYLGQLIGCWYKKYHIFSNVKEIFERKGEGGRKRGRGGGTENWNE